MIKIVPLIIPNIDLKSFIKACSEVFKFNPLSGVDKSSRQFTDPAKFLIGISAFHNRQNLKIPLSSLRQAGSLHTHLSYTFLVAAPKPVILKSLERTELNHTIAEELEDLQFVILSGTLAEFKAATLENCHPDVDHELRLLYDGLYLYFQKCGLGELWFDTVKSKGPNGTFYLENKK